MKAELTQSHLDLAKAATPRTGPSKWRICAGALIVLAGFAATYDAWADIANIAMKDEEASHVFLVPLAVAWLIWVRRDRLKDWRFRGRWLGPLLVLIGGLSHSLAHLYLIRTPWYGGAILVVVGCLVSVAGRDVLWKFLPALIALGFLVPMPRTIRLRMANPMALWAAQLTEQFFTLCGVAVERSGILLSINRTDVTIAEACNGLRMIYALFLATFTFAFVNPLRWPVRLLLLASAPLSAILCNIVRLIPTLWIYGHFSSAWAENFHAAAGWAMLVVSFLILMALIRLLEWTGVEVTEEDDKVAAEVTEYRSDGVTECAPASRRHPVTPSPRHLPSTSSPPPSLALSLAPLLSLALLSGVIAEKVVFYAPRSAAAQYHESVRSAAASAGMRAGLWVGTDIPIPPVAVAMLQPNVILSKRYENFQTGHTVSFLLVQCRDARDLQAHYPPSCYKGRGWLEQTATPRTWRIGDLTIDGTEYEFTSVRFDRADGLIIDNFMLLPGGRTCPDMKGVDAAADDYRQTFLGAAQVQVVANLSVPAPERQEAFEALIQAHRKLIDAILAGEPLKDDKVTR